MRSREYIGAVGIAVSDLQKSATFYKEALGMLETQSFKLDHMDEIVLNHEGRNAVVLMHYTDGSNPNTKNLPVKLVFYVADPVAVAKKMRDLGCEITREPAPLPSFGNAIVGLGRDPDGYTIELLAAKPA